METKDYIEGTEPLEVRADYNITEFPVPPGTEVDTIHKSAWGPTKPSPVVEELLEGHRVCKKNSIEWAKGVILSQRGARNFVAYWRDSHRAREKALNEDILLLPSLMMAATEDLGMSFGLAYTLYSESKECIFNAIATQYGVIVIPRRPVVRDIVIKCLLRSTEAIRQDTDCTNELMGSLVYDNIVPNKILELVEQLTETTNRGLISMYESVNPNRKPLSANDIGDLGGTIRFLHSWASGDLTVIANDSFSGTPDEALSAQPAHKVSQVSSASYTNSLSNGLSRLLSPPGMSQPCAPLSQLLYYRQAPLPDPTLIYHRNGIVTSRMAGNSARYLYLNKNITEAESRRVIGALSGLRSVGLEDVGKSVFKYANSIWEGPAVSGFEYDEALGAYKLSLKNMYLNLETSTLYVNLASDASYEKKGDVGDILRAPAIAPGFDITDMPILYKKPLAALDGEDTHVSARARLNTLNHLVYGNVNSRLDLSLVERITTMVLNMLCNPGFEYKPVAHHNLVATARSKYLNRAGRALGRTIAYFSNYNKIKGEFIPLDIKDDNYNRVDAWFKQNCLASNDFYSVWEPCEDNGYRMLFFVRKTSEGFLFTKIYDLLGDKASCPKIPAIITILESNPLVLQQNNIGPLTLPFMARTDILIEDYALASMGDATHSTYPGYDPCSMSVAREDSFNVGRRYSGNVATLKADLKRGSRDSVPGVFKTTESTWGRRLSSGLRLLNDLTVPGEQTGLGRRGHSELDKLVELIRTGQFQPTGGFQLNVKRSSTGEEVSLIPKSYDPQDCCELYTILNIAFLPGQYNNTANLSGKLEKPYYPHSGAIKEVVLEGAFGGGTSFFTGSILHTKDIAPHHIGVFKPIRDSEFTYFNCTARTTYVTKGTMNIRREAIDPKSGYAYSRSFGITRGYLQNYGEDLRYLELHLPTTVGRTTYNDVLLAGLLADNLDRLSAVLRGIRSPFQFDLDRSDFMFKSLTESSQATRQRGDRGIESLSPLPYADYIAAPTISTSKLRSSSAHIYKKNTTNFYTSERFNLDMRHISKRNQERFDLDAHDIIINPLDSAQMAAFMPGVIATEVLEEELRGESLSKGLRDLFGFSVACIIASPRGGGGESYLEHSKDWRAVREDIDRRYSKMGDIMPPNRKEPRTYTVIRSNLKKQV